MHTHQHYMAKALALAEMGRYTVSPNPMVGCVIVQDNNIIGQGYHQRAGQHHAEIIALKEAGDRATAATAYVTLEPCCHHGKTPPCTEAIIRSGIKRVVVACKDPNPLVSGSGIEALKNAGIEVICGVEEEQAKTLNEIFFHYMLHKTPFVIAKWAMSLDGQMQTAATDDRYISSDAALNLTHRLRQQADAILIGSRTALKDNPQLTVRTENGNLQGKQPTRIVLNTKGDLPADLKIFKDDLLGNTLLVMSNKHRPSISAKNVEILAVNETENGKIDLNELLIELGKREICSLLVEGGRTIHDSFIENNLVNRIYTYVSPVIISTLSKKKKLTQLKHQLAGEDHIFTAKYGD